MTALSTPRVPTPSTIGLHRRLARICDAAGHIRTMAIDHPENYLRLFDADLDAVSFEEVVESKLDMLRVLSRHATSVLVDPVWSFGQSVAAVGDYIVVGIPLSDFDSTDNGWLHVFDAATGALVRTIQNPNPVPPNTTTTTDQFGLSLAAVGTDKVLVGAPFNDRGASSAGAAYLFEITTGRLLAALQKPTTVANDQFGFSVGAGGDRLAVGANLAEIGATTDAGAAYVFQVQPLVLGTAAPPLPSVRRSAVQAVHPSTASPGSSMPRLFPSPARSSRPADRSTDEAAASRRPSPRRSSSQIELISCDAPQQASATIKHRSFHSNNSRQLE